MSSRAEYFLNLAKESTDLNHVNVVATGFCLTVFLLVCLVFALRRPERDKALALLPFDDN